MAAALRSPHNALALLAPRRDRRRGARLPASGRALQGCSPTRDRRRGPQPAVLSRPPAGHRRVRGAEDLAMQVLYEEEGELKVGAVLAQAPASLQVESPHGRRSKVEAANVLLEFERPSGAELLVEAQRFAAGLDADFLWQCCGAREFGFQDLAREYVGRLPSPAEAAGRLMKLHSAPIFFYLRVRPRPLT